ncbi:antirepressor [Campylobacter jejuni]|uniref:antirepressor n=1 Tax=Campylobacter jejuni TaxID=197 RepID=UPI000444E610|nr:antirepressor [Campylobacter jejuni]AHW91536.1 putative phage anti-repressor protein [Campylobacter jejuni subsp. jejuni R14]
MNLLQCEICQITRSFLNTEVAYNYAVDNTTIMSHKNLHSDELIENIHYFYDYAQTKGGRQRVIKWTLEGVYMLGFFIKSPKAKEYRKKVAKLLREQTQARFKTLSDENQRLNSLNHHQKIGYKSQLKQQKEHYENKIKALQYDLEHKKELSFKRKLSKEELLELRKILAKDYDMVCIKEWEFEFLAEKIALESTRITTWDAVVKKLKQTLDYWQNYEEYEEKWRKILRR